MVARPISQITTRARPGAGRNRNPAQAQRGNHVEHHQVAETQDPLGLRSIGHVRRVDALVRQCVRICRHSAQHAACLQTAGPALTTANNIGRTPHRASSPSFRTAFARHDCRSPSPRSGCRLACPLPVDEPASSARVPRQVCAASSTTYRSLRIHCRVKLTDENTG